MEDVEAHAFRAWPAVDTATIGAWTAHAAGGFSRRVNSAAPGGSIEAIDEVLAAAGEWYTSRGLPLVVRITPGDDVIDVELEARGFTREGSTDVMVADVGPAEFAPGVEVSSRAAGVWLEVQARLQGVPQSLLESWEGIISWIEPPAGFALAPSEGGPIAAGLAVSDGRWLGLFEINVAAAERRRGVGRRLSTTLLGWGAAAGARRAYLQVVHDNHPAQASYRSLGFEPVYRYWYRRAPTP